MTPAWTLLPFIKAEKRKTLGRHGCSKIRGLELSQPTVAGLSLLTDHSTYCQDDSVSLQKISQLVQESSSAQGIHLSPWRPPLECCLRCFHRIIHIRLKQPHTQENLRLQGRSWTMAQKPHQAASQMMLWWLKPSCPTKPLPFYSWIRTQACNKFWVWPGLVNNLGVRVPTGSFKGNFMQLVCLYNNVESCSC